MKVTLEDVSEKAGSNLAQKDIVDLEGDYPIYGASGYIGNVDFYHQDRAYIAVVKDGAGVGRTMYLPEKSSVIGTLQYIIPKENIVPKYLYYAIKNMHLEKYYMGAAIPHIYYKDYKHEVFELPDQMEQLKIVDILDKTEEIIKTSSLLIDELDELIKSRFVEMFGTLDDPSQSFHRDKLKNICTKITDGKHGGCTAEEGTGRYFVGAREIYDDEVHYDTAPEINIAQFEKDYKRCNVEKGDFLIVNTGATIGKSAIAIDEKAEYTLLQKSVALLKVKRELLNPVFLKWCYRINTKMYMVESASAQPNLLLSKIKETEIYLPDIGLQNEFADFVTFVDKLKVAYTYMERKCTL